MTQRFSEEGCAIETPVLSGLSIDTLGRLHRASINAGDLLEGLGWATSNQEAQRILHALGMSFCNLQNEIVGELKARAPATNGDRETRARALLDDACRCLVPSEYPTELTALVRELCDAS